MASCRSTRFMPASFTCFNANTLPSAAGIACTAMLSCCFIGGSSLQATRPLAHPF
jgi:hypothetical protein